MENPHLTALEMKHETLDARIRAEHGRPSSDDLEIARLKKEKLRLKDELRTG